MGGSTEGALPGQTAGAHNAFLARLGPMDPNPGSGQPSFLAQYWWLLLLVVPIIILLLLVLRRKKGKGPQEAPTAAPPASPPGQ